MGTRSSGNLLGHAGQVTPALTPVARPISTSLPAGRPPSGAVRCRRTATEVSRRLPFASGSTARCSTSAQPAPGTATTRLEPAGCAMPSTVTPDTLARLPTTARSIRMRPPSSEMPRTRSAPEPATTSATWATEPSAGYA